MLKWMLCLTIVVMGHAEDKTGDLPPIILQPQLADPPQSNSERNDNNVIAVLTQNSDSSLAKEEHR